MNFCTNCGVKLVKSNIFCVECGLKIRDSPVDKNVVFENDNLTGLERNKFRFKTEKKFKNTPKFIVLLFILAIISGGFVYFIAQYNSDGIEDSKRPQRSLIPLKERTERPQRPQRPERPQRPQRPERPKRNY